LQKRTQIQWDIGAALGTGNGADESTSPQAGIRQIKKTTPDKRSKLYDRTVQLELIGVALLVIFILWWNW
jgi:hypothetical protein